MNKKDKKYVKRAIRERDKAAKELIADMKRKGRNLSESKEREIKVSARELAIIREAERRMRAIEKDVGNTRKINREKLIAQVRKDFKEVENKRFPVRVAAILAAAGITFGVGNKLLPESTADERAENPTNASDRMDENEMPEKNGEMLEGNGEAAALSIEEERNISEEVYFKLKDSTTDEIKEYCEKIYADIYQEKTGEEIDPETLEIRQGHEDYSYEVTLQDGRKVIILHGERPLETEQKLNELEKVEWEERGFGRDPYYLIYQKDQTQGNGERILIDGNVSEYSVTTIDSLKSYLEEENQNINQVATRIPSNIWNIMILAMSGDKNLSNQQLIDLSRWIRDNNLHQCVLGEEQQSEQENEGHSVETEALSMADEAETLSKENKTNGFLEQLRVDFSQEQQPSSNATPNNDKQTDRDDGGR